MTINRPSLERLLKAVDEAVLYKTVGKLQELRQIREDFRMAELASLVTDVVEAFAPENINQVAYRGLFRDDY